MVSLSGGSRAEVQDLRHASGDRTHLGLQRSVGCHKRVWRLHCALWGLVAHPVGHKVGDALQVCQQRTGRTQRAQRGAHQLAHPTLVPASAFQSCIASQRLQQVRTVAGLHKGLVSMRTAPHVPPGPSGAGWRDAAGAAWCTPACAPRNHSCQRNSIMHCAVSACSRSELWQACTWGLWACMHSLTCIQVRQHRAGRAQQAQRGIHQLAQAALAPALALAGQCALCSLQFEGAFARAESGRQGISSSRKAG